MINNRIWKYEYTDNKLVIIDQYFDTAINYEILYYFQT